MRRQILFYIFSLFLTNVFAQNIFINKDKLEGFSIEYEDVETPYNISSLFTLAGEKVIIKANTEGSNKDFIFLPTNGVSYPIGRNEWLWEIPDTLGHYSAKIIEINSNEIFTLNCFVIFPYEELKGSSLNAFRIGHYPNSDNKIYRKPEGFIEVTPLMLDLQLSPNFKVRDFLCKQECEFPMYLVLKEKLIVKLEKIFEKLNEKGYDVNNISIMSGYRTPYYNKSIGNVQFSRHQFGDAADIYVDNDGDNYMDDLNKDGRSDKKDVQILYNTIIEMTKEEWYKDYIGGLGFYNKNAVRTGFVHVDVRGHEARW